MSTNRMIEEMSKNSNTTRVKERTVSEPEILEHFGIDTGYYHPNSHPRDEIRSSFENNRSPDPIIRSQIADTTHESSEFKKPEPIRLSK